MNRPYLAWALVGLGWNIGEKHRPVISNPLPRSGASRRVSRPVPRLCSLFNLQSQADQSRTSQSGSVGVFFSYELTPLVIQPFSETGFSCRAHVSPHSNISLSRAIPSVRRIFEPLANVAPVKRLIFNSTERTSVAHLAKCPGLPR